MFFLSEEKISLVMSAWAHAGICRHCRTTI